MIGDRVEVAGHDERKIGSLVGDHRPELRVLPGPQIATAVRVAGVHGENADRSDFGDVCGRGPLHEGGAGQR